MYDDSDEAELRLVSASVCSKMQRGAAHSDDAMYSATSLCCGEASRKAVPGLLTGITATYAPFHRLEAFWKTMQIGRRSVSSQVWSGGRVSACIMRPSGRHSLRGFNV
jgi:hypothetical protein